MKLLIKQAFFTLSLYIYSKFMQSDNFSNRPSMKTQLVTSIKSQLVYEKYKTKPISYQKMAAVERIIDNQIRVLTHQNNFELQAKLFYQHAKNSSLNEAKLEQQPHNLAASQDIDGVRMHFVYNQEEKHQYNLANQHKKQRMEAEQPISQEKKCIFSKIYTNQMDRGIMHFSARPQEQMISGRQKNVQSYFKNRNLTLGVLRRLLRDCFKASLLYQRYAEQVNQECNHSNKCCERQKEALSEIYEMHIQFLNLLYSQGKQSLLRQLFANNCDVLLRKPQSLEQKKKIDKKEQKS